MGCGHKAKVQPKTLQEEMKPKMQIQVFSHKEEPPKDSIALNLDWV